MPAMASITVKKADGTTDIIYDAVNGAAGDASDAYWRQDTGAAAALPWGMRAAMWFRSLWNGPRTGRKIAVTYKRPYATLNSTTGRYESKDETVIRVEALLPITIPPGDHAEAIHQCANLMASTLIKSTMVTGGSPT